MELVTITIKMIPDNIVPDIKYDIRHVQMPRDRALKISFSFQLFLSGHWLLSVISFVSSFVIKHKSNDKRLLRATNSEYRVLGFSYTIIPVFICGV